MPHVCDTFYNPKVGHQSASKYSDFIVTLLPTEIDMSFLWYHLEYVILFVLLVTIWLSWIIIFTCSNVKVQIPRKTRNNGTLFMHAVLLDNDRLYEEFDKLIHTEAVHTLPLVTHIEPQAETFNLLQQQVIENIF